MVVLIISTHTHTFQAGKQFLPYDNKHCCVQQYILTSARGSISCEEKEEEKEEEEEDRVYNVLINGVVLIQQTNTSTDYICMFTYIQHNTHSLTITTGMGYSTEFSASRILKSLKDRFFWMSLISTKL